MEEKFNNLIDHKIRILKDGLKNGVITKEDRNLLISKRDELIEEATVKFADDIDSKIITEFITLRFEAELGVS